VPLRDPAVGDLLVVPGDRAYCFTMSNNYNGARRIPVVFADGGEARLVVRRGDLDRPAGPGTSIRDGARHAGVARRAERA
jgi:hypothetical protein